MEIQLDRRIQTTKGGGSRIYLQHADRIFAVNNLALQVAAFNHIGIHQTDGADTGCGEIQRGRRSQTARAEQQHLAVHQPDLARFTHFRNQQVT